MESWRKRTRDLCDCQTTPIPNNVAAGSVLHCNHIASPDMPERVQFHNTVDLVGMMSPADDHIFGRQQKRKCNGVSSFLPHTDHAKEYTRDACTPRAGCGPSAADETVAMATDSVATSYHSQSIPPASSTHHARQGMTGAEAKATNFPGLLQPQYRVRKVCQRCLSGEPGHITHIVS